MSSMSNVPVEAALQPFSRLGLGGRHMNNGLTLVAFVAVWYLLQVWLLPRLGVPT